jgi:hypothetical protein
MADAWKTYSFEFKGGLVTNLSPLQQGVNLPGSARTLKNFEPSITGGYKRIEGFAKYSTSFVPSHGDLKVHGSGQTGTVLTVGNVFVAPIQGEQFTISGVTGTYTIAAGGVVYDNTYKRATLTLTTSLASSPADKALLTFTSQSGKILGLASWQGKTLAARGGDIFSSTGGSWTKINVPSYGTVLVNGAAQTGASLIIDGISGNGPRQGETFTIAGVNKIYTVLANPTIVSGGTTLSIDPALASSPADNAAITWLSVDRSDQVKLRFTKYRIAGTEKIAGVDGHNYPFIYDGTTFTEIVGSTDIEGAEFICFHKNQLFIAKGNILTFTAPYTDSDLTAVNGGGVISVGAQITGLIVFREALVIFTERTINQLVGNTIADFVLQPVTRNVGCVAPDTIQEMGGDVIFLGPDGLRLFSLTDRVGDFNLGLVSKPIQTQLTDLIATCSSFSSVLIRQKSQYRLLGYSETVTAPSAKGILGTQTASNDTSSIAWGELSGIRAYVADSNYVNAAETVVFSHTDGYVYQMESGSSFDGGNITAYFSTPFVFMDDARLRKTIYKMLLYTDPRGSVDINVSMKVDFDTIGSIQPNAIPLSNVTSAVGFYGSAIAKYGTTTYGTKLKKLFETQLIGSGFAVSLQFVSEGTDPPFSLDAATLEYSLHDRR